MQCLANELRQNWVQTVWCHFYKILGKISWSKMAQLGQWLSEDGKVEDNERERETFGGVGHLYYFDHDNSWVCTKIKTYQMKYL